MKSSSALWPLICLLSLPALATPLSQSKARQLKELRTQVRTWAAHCEDGSMTNENCPFGDQTIFAGLMCLSGESDRCEDVKKSQSHTGEWFRAPGLVGEISPGATFSRDQTRGLLAYLVATKDKEAAIRWMNFVENNNYRTCKGKTSTCNLRPNTWYEIGRVWDYLELPRNKKMRGWNIFYDSMYRGLEARYQLADYPIHLNAASIYIKNEIDKKTGVIHRHAGNSQKVLKILGKRWPYNPFINYLRFGPTEEAADVVLKYCPGQAPPLINGELRRDWIWQRAIEDRLDHSDPSINEISWNYPGGHDCIFMINLLVGAERSLK